MQMTIIEDQNYPQEIKLGESVNIPIFLTIYKIIK